MGSRKPGDELFPVSDPQLRGALFIHESCPGFAVSIIPKTAPCPLLRLERQSALDRIAMHVAQLLHTLAFAPHHKIIEPPLPHVAFVQCVLPQPVLAALTALAPILAEPSARSAVLE